MSAGTAQTGDEAAARRELPGRLPRALARASGRGSRLLRFRPHGRRHRRRSRPHAGRKARAPRRARAGARRRRSMRFPKPRGFTPPTRGTGPASMQARDLLRAFRQDAVKARYADWAELIDYCRLSANPVGRFLLGLHRERERRAGPGRRALHGAADPQPPAGLRPDREHSAASISRCAGWLARLRERPSSIRRTAPLRRDVLDAMLDRVDALIDQAQIPAGASARTGACGRRASPRSRSPERLSARLRRERSGPGRACR